MRAAVTDSTGYWDAALAPWVEERRNALWRTHSDAVNSGLLAEWLPARVSRLLKTDLFDEAVSTGLYPVLETRADAVLGVDVAESTLRLARERYPGLFAVQADVRELPFADGDFDAVVSISTLDHFPRREDIADGIAELRRVLAPGGSFLITLDNGLNPLVALRNALPFRLLNRVGLVPYYVGPTLGPLGLRRSLEEAGFDVLELRAIMHCPRVAAIALGRPLDRRGSPGARRTFLRSLLACEVLGRLPSAMLTGHFVAARAVRR
jgi:SAM-dependent methyltransferase